MAKPFGGDVTGSSQTERKTIDPIFKPYILAALQQASDIANRPYIPYAGQQVANLNPDQYKGIAMARRLAARPLAEGGIVRRFADGSTTTATAPTPAGAYTKAGQAASAVTERAINMQNYTPGQVSSNYTAGNYNPTGFTSQTVNAGPVQTFGMGPAQQVSSTNTSVGPLKTFAMDTPTANAATGQTVNAVQTADVNAQQTNQPTLGTQANISAYMDPYTQGVVDIAKRKALQDAEKQRVARMGGAARAGAFGGYREGVEEAEANRTLNEQLQDIQARGLQQSYQAGQEQFNKDVTNLMATGQFNAQQANQIALQNQQTRQQSNLANQQAALEVQRQNVGNIQQTNLANQQAGLTAGQQNLASQQATQQLGIESQLRSDLANQQAQLEAQKANQQAGLTVGQQNLASQNTAQQLGIQTALEAQRSNQQADLEAQRMAEQSKQFEFTGEQGAQQQAAQQAMQAGQYNVANALEARQQGLAALGTGLQGAQQMVGTEQALRNADVQAQNQIMAAGQAQQQNQQQLLDTIASNWDKFQNFDINQLNKLLGMLNAAGAQNFATSQQEANPKAPA